MRRSDRAAARHAGGGRAAAVCGEGHARLHALGGRARAGGRRAAAIYTLIETAKLSDVDPQAWLTDVLARLQDHPARRIAELLPWNWKLLQQPQ